MKKQNQLGMNPSTASHRLVKDILYSLIVETGRNTCYKCGKPMCRKTFSIEHITPWLDSEDPAKLFFDLQNISFSHKSCNYESRRIPEPKHGGITRYKQGCRCNLCTEYIKGYYKMGNQARDSRRASAN